MWGGEDIRGQVGTGKDDEDEEEDEDQDQDNEKDIRGHSREGQRGRKDESWLEDNRERTRQSRRI